MLGVAFRTRSSPAETRDDCFHPRYRLWETDSFGELGADWQVQLRELHDAHFLWHQGAPGEATARQRLSMLQRCSNMMVVGDDVGQASQSLPKVLEDRAIPCARIPRLADPRSADGAPATLPYLSVATSSTHDMPTLAGWWGSLSAADRELQWTLVGGKGGPPAADGNRTVTAAVTSCYVASLMRSPAMLAVFPMQDLLDTHASTASADPSADQINFPGEAERSWRWRCAVDVEDAVHNVDFIGHVRSMVEAGDRLIE